MPRPRRRYVNRRETKLSEAKPRHRQWVTFRIRGHKSYVYGEYDKILGEFHTPSGSAILESYVQGWMPCKTKPREVDLWRDSQAR